MKQIQEEQFEVLHMVIGMVSDKNIDDVLSLFPKKATYYFCKPNIQRGLDAKILANKFIAKGFSGASFKSVHEAYNTARKNASKVDLIYVGGSTFVVAEIL